MQPLLDSIDPVKLEDIKAGDYVVFRLVNGDHFSGKISEVETQVWFSFVGRGGRLHAIEIACVEEHDRRPCEQEGNR